MTLSGTKYPLFMPILFPFSVPHKSHRVNVLSRVCAAACISRGSTSRFSRLHTLAKWQSWLARAAKQGLSWFLSMTRCCGAISHPPLVVHQVCVFVSLMQTRTSERGFGSNDHAFLVHQFPKESGLDSLRTFSRNDSTIFPKLLGELSETDPRSQPRKNETQRHHSHLISDMQHTGT